MSNVSHKWIIQEHRKELETKGVSHQNFTDEQLTYNLGKELEGKYGRAALERYSPDFTLNYIKQKNARLAKREGREGFLGSLKELPAGLGQGIDETQGMLYGGLGALAKTANQETLADWATDKAMENMEESKDRAPTIQSYRDVTDLGSLGRYLTGGVGRVIPSAATMVGTGGVTGLAGKQILKKSVVGPAIRKEIAKRNASTAYTGSSNALRRQVGKKWDDLSGEAQDIAKAYAYGVGMQGGTMASSGTMGIGEVYTSLHPYTQLDPQHKDYVTPEDALQASWGFGLAIGALDSVVPTFLGQKVLKKFYPGKTNIDAVDGARADAFVKKSLLSNVAKGMAIEGSTEATQEYLNVIAEKFVHDKPFTLTEDETAHLIDGGILGMIGGATFGLAGTAIENRRGEQIQEQRREELLQARADRNREYLEQIYDLEQQVEEIAPSATYTIGDKVSYDGKEATIVESADGSGPSMGLATIEYRKTKRDKDLTRETVSQSMIFPFTEIAEQSEQEESTPEPEATSPLAPADDISDTEAVQAVPQYTLESDESVIEGRREMNVAQTVDGKSVTFTLPEYEATELLGVEEIGRHLTREQVLNGEGAETLRKGNNGAQKEYEQWSERFYPRGKQPSKKLFLDSAISGFKKFLEANGQETILDAENAVQEQQKAKKAQEAENLKNAANEAKASAARTQRIEDQKNAWRNTHPKKDGFLVKTGEQNEVGTYDDILVANARRMKNGQEPLEIQPVTQKEYEDEKARIGSEVGSIQVTGEKRTFKWGKDYEQYVEYIEALSQAINEDLQGNLDSIIEQYTPKAKKPKAKKTSAPKAPDSSPKDEPDLIDGRTLDALPELVDGDYFLKIGESNLKFTVEEDAYVYGGKPGEATSIPELIRSARYDAKQTGKPTSIIVPYEDGKAKIDIEVSSDGLSLIFKLKEDYSETLLDLTLKEFEVEYDEAVELVNDDKEWDPKTWEEIKANHAGASGGKSSAYSRLVIAIQHKDGQVMVRTLRSGVIKKLFQFKSDHKKIAPGVQASGGEFEKLLGIKNVSVLSTHVFSKPVAVQANFKDREVFENWLGDFERIDKVQRAITPESAQQSYLESREGGYELPAPTLSAVRKFFLVDENGVPVEQDSRLVRSPSVREVVETDAKYGNLRLPEIQEEMEEQFPQILKSIQNEADKYRQSVLDEDGEDSERKGDASKQRKKTSWPTTSDGRKEFGDWLLSEYGQGKDANGNLVRTEHQGFVTPASLTKAINDIQRAIYEKLLADEQNKSTNPNEVSIRSGEGSETNPYENLGNQDETVDQYNSRLTVDADTMKGDALSIASRAFKSLGGTIYPETGQGGEFTAGELRLIEEFIKKRIGVNELPSTILDEIIELGRNNFSPKTDIQNLDQDRVPSYYIWKTFFNVGQKNEAQENIVIVLKALADRQEVEVAPPPPKPVVSEKGKKATSEVSEKLAQTGKGIDWNAVEGVISKTVRESDAPLAQAFEFTDENREHFNVAYAKVAKSILTRQQDATLFKDVVESVLLGLDLDNASDIAESTSQNFLNIEEENEDLWINKPKPSSAFLNKLGESIGNELAADIIVALGKHGMKNLSLNSRFPGWKAFTTHLGLKVDGAPLVVMLTDTAQIELKTEANKDSPQAPFGAPIDASQSAALDDLGGQRPGMNTLNDSDESQEMSDLIAKNQDFNYSHTQVIEEGQENINILTLQDMFPLMGKELNSPIGAALGLERVSQIVQSSNAKSETKEFVGKLIETLNEAMSEMGKTIQVEVVSEIASSPGVITRALYTNSDGRIIISKKFFAGKMDPIGHKDVLPITGNLTQDVLITAFLHEAWHGTMESPLRLHEDAMLKGETSPVADTVDLINEVISEIEKVAVNTGRFSSLFFGDKKYVISEILNRAWTRKDFADWLSTIEVSEGLAKRINENGKGLIKTLLDALHAAYIKLLGYFGINVEGNALGALLDLSKQLQAHSQGMQPKETVIEMVAMADQPSPMFHSAMAKVAAAAGVNRKSEAEIEIRQQMNQIKNKIQRIMGNKEATPEQKQLERAELVEEQKKLKAQLKDLDKGGPMLKAPEKADGKQWIKWFMDNGVKKEELVATGIYDTLMLDFRGSASAKEALANEAVKDEVAKLQALEEEELSEIDDARNDLRKKLIDSLKEISGGQDIEITSLRREDIEKLLEVIPGHGPAQDWVVGGRVITSEAYDKMYLKMGSGDERFTDLVDTASNVEILLMAQDAGSNFSQNDPDYINQMGDLKNAIRRFVSQQQKSKSPSRSDVMELYRDDPRPMKDVTLQDIKRMVEIANIVPVISRSARVPQQMAGGPAPTVRSELVDMTEEEKEYYFPFGDSQPEADFAYADTMFDSKFFGEPKEYILIKLYAPSPARPGMGKMPYEGELVGDHRASGHYRRAHLIETLAVRDDDDRVIDHVPHGSERSYPFVHVRMAVYEINGVDTMVVHEIQSDAHQKNAGGELFVKRKILPFVAGPDLPSVFARQKKYAWKSNKSYKKGQVVHGKDRRIFIAKKDSQGKEPALNYTKGKIKLLDDDEYWKPMGRLKSKVNAGSLVRNTPLGLQPKVLIDLQKRVESASKKMPRGNHDERLWDTAEMAGNEAVTLEEAEAWANEVLSGTNLFISVNIRKELTSSEFDAPISQVEISSRLMVLPSQAHSGSHLVFSTTGLDSQDGAKKFVLQGDKKNYPREIDSEVPVLEALGYASTIGGFGVETYAEPSLAGLNALADSDFLLENITFPKKIFANVKFLGSTNRDKFYTSMVGGDNQQYVQMAGKAVLRQMAVRKINNLLINRGDMIYPTVLSGGDTTMSGDIQAIVEDVRETPVGTKKELAQDRLIKTEGVSNNYTLMANMIANAFGVESKITTLRGEEFADNEVMSIEVSDERLSQNLREGEPFFMQDDLINARKEARTNLSINKVSGNFLKRGKFIIPDDGGEGTVVNEQVYHVEGLTTDIEGRGDLLTEESVSKIVRFVRNPSRVGVLALDRSGQPLVRVQGSETYYRVEEGAGGVWMAGSEIEAYDPRDQAMSDDDQITFDFGLDGELKQEQPKPEPPQQPEAPEIENVDNSQKALTRLVANGLWWDETDLYGVDGDLIDEIHGKSGIPKSVIRDEVKSLRRMYTHTPNRHRVEFMRLAMDQGIKKYFGPGQGMSDDSETGDKLSPEQNVVDNAKISMAALNFEVAGVAQVMPELARIYGDEKLDVDDAYRKLGIAGAQNRGTPTKRANKLKKYADDMHLTTTEKLQGNEGMHNEAMGRALSRLEQAIAKLLKRKSFNESLLNADVEGSLASKLEQAESVKADPASLFNRAKAGDEIIKQIKNDVENAIQAINDFVDPENNSLVSAFTELTGQMPPANQFIEKVLKRDDASYYADLILQLSSFPDINKLTLGEVYQVVINDGRLGNDTTSAVVIANALYRKKRHIREAKLSTDREKKGILDTIEKIHQANKEELYKFKNFVEKNSNNELLLEHIEERLKVFGMQEEMAEIERQNLAIDAVLTSLELQATKAKMYVGYNPANHITDGTKFPVMKKTEDGWEMETMEVKLNNRMQPTDLDGLKKALIGNYQYLKEAKSGTPEFNYVKRMWMNGRALIIWREHTEANAKLGGYWLKSAQEKFSNLGLGGKEQARMLLEFDIALREHRPEAGRWSRIFNENVLKASKSWGYGENYTKFFDDFIGPIVKFSEDNPSLINAEDFHSRAYEIAKGLARKEPGESARQDLREMLEVYKDISEWFVSISKRYGMKVQEDKKRVRDPHTGELVSLQRDPIRRGYLTVGRKLRSETVKFIVNELQDQNWASREDLTEGDEVIVGLDSLREKMREKENYEEKNELLNKWIEQHVTPSIVERFIAPYVYNTSPREFIKTPDKKDGIGRAYLVKAWELSEGEGAQKFISWIETLYGDERIGLRKKIDRSDFAQFKYNIINNFVGRYKTLTNAVSDVGKHGDNKAYALAHRLMDSRAMDAIIPIEFLEYETYDEVSMPVQLAQLVGNSIFGRNAERLLAVNETLKQDLQGKTEILNQEAMALGARRVEGGVPKLTKTQKLQLESVLEQQYPSIPGKTGKQKLANLIAATRSFPVFSKATAHMNAYFNNDMGPYKDLKTFYEVLGTNAFLVLNQQKSGLTNLLSLGDQMITYKGFNEFGIKATANSLNSLLGQFFGGLFQRFGEHIGLSIDAGWSHEYGDELMPIFFNSNENDVGFRNFRLNIGARGTKNASNIDMFRIDGLRQMKQVIQYAPNTDNRKYAPFGFRTLFLNPFTYLGNLANHSLATAAARGVDQLVRKVAAYIEETNAMLEKAGKMPLGEDEQITAEMLGFPRGGWKSALMGSAELYDYINNALELRGMGTLSNLARDYMERKARGDDRVLTKEQVIAAGTIALHDVAMEGGFASRASFWYSNPLARAFSPLQSWSFAKVNQMNNSMRDQEKGHLQALALARTLAISSMWVVPLGMMFTFGMDEYDEEVLGKASPLRPAPLSTAIPIFGPFIEGDTTQNLKAMTERLSRAGNLGGVAMDFVANMYAQVDPYGYQRGFSLDTRVLAMSQFLNVKDAALNAAHSGGIDYNLVVRPLLFSVGGNSFLQNYQMFSNFLDHDSTERRIVNQIGNRNKIRAALGMLEIERRPMAGGTFRATPFNVAIRGMERAALAGDNEDFSEFYKKAIEESRLRGDADPEKKVLDAFKRRNLRTGISRYTLDDEDWNRVTGVFKPEYAKSLIHADRMHKAYVDTLKNSTTLKNSIPPSYVPQKKKRKSYEELINEALSL